MHSVSESNRTGVLAIVLGAVATALSIVAIVRPPVGDSGEATQQELRGDSVVNPGTKSELGQAKTADSLPNSGRNSTSNSLAGASSSEATDTANSGLDRGRSPTVRLPEKAIPASKEELEAEATFVANQIQQLLPNEPMAKHVNAMLFAQLHKTEKAEELWRECVQMAPDVEQYYVNLAAILIDRGENDDAIEILQAAKDRGIDSLDINHHLGLSLTNAGRADEALPIIKEALDKQPDSASHWLLQGQAQLKLGQFEEAEASLRKAVELGAQTKTAYFSLFNACMRNGNREDAKKFQEIYSQFGEQELDPQERYQILSESEARQIAINVLSETALLYEAAGGIQDTEHLLLRIVALEPQNLAALNELARLYQSQQRYADERLIRSKLVAAEPTNLLGYLLLAKAQIGSGDPHAAEASIKLAISLAPQMVTGYAAMTDFLLEQKQPEKAFWYVNHALQLRPSRDGFLLMAKTLRAMGKETEAQQAESEAAKFDEK